MNEIALVLIGIGGYGGIYVNALLKDRKRENWHIEGVVDPYANQAEGYEALLKMGIPFYDDPEAFFAEKKADLAVISTPIALHEAHALCALKNGCHVLLEKPIAATPQAGRRIADEAKRLGRKLAIGFQWCYDPAMLNLKRNFDRGTLGAPVRLRAEVLWARDFAYYRRGTGWAGKKRDEKGNPVFDSIASNATAHYLENMLWLTGKGYEGASLTQMTGETWRANDIETYDTLTLLGKMDNGAELTFVTSHAILPEERQDPMFEYEFENAVVRFGAPGEAGSALTAHFRDGTEVNYGESFCNGTEKIWVMMDAIRDGAEIPCPPEAALRHIDAIADLRKLQPEARLFRRIERSSQRAWVPGLAAALNECYERRALLSKTGNW